MTGERTWTQWWSEWEETCAELDRPVRGLGQSITTWGTAFASADPERDWARWRESMHFVASKGYSHLHGRMDRPEGLPGYHNIFKTPEALISEARETWGDGKAPDEIQLMAFRPGMPIETVVEHWRVFAAEVLPALHAL